MFCLHKKHFVREIVLDDGTYFLCSKAFSAVGRSDLVSPNNLSADAGASKWK
jgi:hypothetical protein